MKILALETSCDQGSAALLQDGVCLQLSLDGSANHSGRILAVIHELMGATGLDFAALDAVAFGAGPGAFTGLRLGCGVAQGIALAAGLPVVAVPSLEALAVAQGDGKLWVASDARMGEVYSAAYHVVDGLISSELAAPVCVPPELLAVPEGDGWIAAGSAFAVYGEAFAARAGSAVNQWVPDAVPRAEWVARLAAHKLSTGGGISPEEAAPLYVRDKVALTTAERLARGGRV